MSMEQNKEHAFDAFCKRVVKNEAVNIQLEYSRQEQQEVVFSDLTPEERRQLQYIDTYAPERRVFRLFGMDMEISDGNLGRALDAVSKERRDIAGGTTGETQCHCYQPDEGADGRSQNFAARCG